MAVIVDKIRQAQRAMGPATVLAIGTANPSNCYDQSTYADYFFRVINSEHKTELKEKFKRMCDATMIKKRQGILNVEVPKLGKEVAEKAINEWGQSKSKITHLVFCTTSGVDLPGADYQLTKLLGLGPSVKRFMMYQQGCSGVSSMCDLNEAGLVVKIHKDTPMLISKNIERILVEAFEPLGISNWNSNFWVSHAGGRAILDQTELKLGLKPEKLKATRNVMRDYGNMGAWIHVNPMTPPEYAPGATVLFVLDEMRKSSIKKGLYTTGEGLDWGMLFGFGPELAIEAVVLRSVPI